MIKLIVLRSTCLAFSYFFFLSWKCLNQGNQEKWRGFNNWSIFFCLQVDGPISEGVGGYKCMG